VLLPVYNAGDDLKLAVRSVLEQSFTDFELLIGDSSTDGSSNFLADLAAKDPRVLLCKEAKLGLTASLNAGLSRARAPLLARMDADDIALPNRLAKQVEFMASHPDTVALGSCIQYIDASGSPGRVVSYPRGQSLVRHLSWGSPLAHPSVLVRTQALRQVGGYRPLFKQSEDYDLWLRLSLVGRLDNLSDCLLRYRVHGGSLSQANANQVRTYSLFAQAAWIIAKRTGVDPLGGLESLPEFDSLPLRPAERIACQARCLALTAHLLGDEFEDPQAGPLLARMRESLAVADVREALAVFHLRCAKRYLARERRRGLRHLGLAMRAHPGACARFAGKAVLQYARRLSQN